MHRAEAPKGSGPSGSGILALWGGYKGPRWRIDRRPKPLRDKRTVQRDITSLRRFAVVKLWGHGLSFRQIGRRLGISHVAAWKLWWQVFDELSEYGRAVQLGREVLERALEEKARGEFLLIVSLGLMAEDYFGKGRRPLD